MEIDEEKSKRAHKKRSTFKRMVLPLLAFNFLSSFLPALWFFIETSNGGDFGWKLPIGLIMVGGIIFTVTSFFSITIFYFNCDEISFVKKLLTPSYFLIAGAGLFAYAYNLACSGMSCLGNALFYLIGVALLLVAIQATFGFTYLAISASRKRMG